MRCSTRRSSSCLDRNKSPVCSEIFREAAAIAVPTTLASRIGVTGATSISRPDMRTAMASRRVLNAPVMTRAIRQTSAAPEIASARKIKDMIASDRLSGASIAAFSMPMLMNQPEPCRRL